MLTHRIQLHKDRLTADSEPLDEDTFFSMLEHDPFNESELKLQFRFYSCKIDNFLSNPEMKRKYDPHVETLNEFFSSDCQSQVTSPKLLEERFNTKESGLFRFHTYELKERRIHSEYLAIQLLWGDVRVEVVNGSDEKLGEWVAYAWSPIRDELYIFGRDFIPTQIIMNMETTPENRGRPSDHLITGANCGPSSLAAYLNISTAEVIEYLPIFRQKGWTNPQHIEKALKEISKDYSHVQYQRSDGKNLSDVVSEFGQGLAFTQYFYGDNEKISHTHWVAFDNHENFGPVVYDVNVYSNPVFGKGNWVPLEEWNNGVEAFVRENFRKQARYKRFDGYFVRDVISAK